MKYAFAFLCVLALAACGTRSEANQSEMRAVYAGHDGVFQMILELSDDGSLRVETPGNPMWLLRVDGINYFIVSDASGDRVIDSRIAAEIMEEVIPPEFLEQMRGPNMPTMEFEDVGEVTINGRSGLGYRTIGFTGSEAQVVISRDPDLAPLRDARADQFEGATSLSPINRQTVEPVIELLRSGAPLRFFNADLETVEFTEIDDSRFELPSAPLDKEATRALMIERHMIPADPIEMPDLPTEAQ